MDRELLRVPEAAERLSLSRSQTYQMAAAGQLPTVRVGRALRIPARELERWVDSRVVSPLSPQLIGGATPTP